MGVKARRVQPGLRILALFFRLGPAEACGVLVGLFARRVPGARLARPFQVDRLVRQAFGPIIFSGRTTESKVASSTNLSAIASSFRVVPFLCAVLATVVALS